MLFERDTPEIKEIRQASLERLESDLLTVEMIEQFQGENLPDDSTRATIERIVGVRREVFATPVEGRMPKLKLLAELHEQVYQIRKAHREG